MDESSVQTAELWLERMRAGDLKARDDLLRHFCGRLEALACKMLRRFPQVKRWAETDDVLQNALLRLLRSLQQVQPTSVSAFFGLAALEMRRELIDLSRHFYGPYGVGARHDSNASRPSGAPPEPKARSDDEAELERWQAFHEGIDRLPAEEREVVSLVYYHGWTQLEVAKLFQLSERTVRRRWESALARLHTGRTG
jgi:RNA polymerase sigma-70 factor (ECF subfamily)